MVCSRDIPVALHDIALSFHEFCVKLQIHLIFKTSIMSAHFDCSIFLTLFHLIHFILCYHVRMSYVVLKSLSIYLSETELYRQI